MTGSFKFFQSKKKIIASGGTWAQDFTPGIIKVIAATELICGIMVIISSFLPGGSQLTFVGAACISLIMLGSIYVHLRRREFKHTIINIAFLLMALGGVYINWPF